MLWNVSKVDINPRHCRSIASVPDYSSVDCSLLDQLCGATAIHSLQGPRKAGIYQSLKKPYLLFFIHGTVFPLDDLIDIWHVIFPLSIVGILVWHFVAVHFHVGDNPYPITI